ncbi:hypothetical protein C8A05DRAFT_42799 [Staphylotrichum tortipilum]|uniref:G-patch domain-containing protein n=1 Tax=Staphylotrichum tortipilum TaxID=2831512 RepID=A0AAN6RV32_9PEZI|nr:hypothetical protein C8A05DRAFT_42799 [Staphylotrichum longicolle]
MAAPPPPPPPRGGMSLYANLLDTDGGASISRGPVLFKDDNDDGPKKPLDPALRFQPIRRPQLKPTTKPKPSFPKAPPPATSAPAPTTTTTTTTTTTAPGSAPQRSTLADWAAQEDDDYFPGPGGGDKRQRGGRKKKKRREQDQHRRETDWDELYDPARPTNVEEYLRSGERVREVREWKAVLYAHRRAASRSGESEDGDGDGGRRGELTNPPTDAQFAPPASLTFAPPPMSPPRAPAAPIPHEATGDDAYARRLALSGRAPPPPPTTTSPPPPPADTTTISRAPVRYSPPPEDDAMDLDAPASPPNPNQQTGGSGGSSTRPGQQGFAQRLMAKYGWTKGAGLGATSSGITSALRVHVEKRRRRPDAEGGGFVGPGGRGRIIAPKSKTQSQPQSQQGEGGAQESGGGSKFGKMSVVVVLDRMLDDMADVEGEVEAGLGQEIGEECGERYGRVERVVVDVEGGRVFIRFVEGVSALRAVNALEGRIFNGNAVVARFYDEERFEEGVYDG